MSVAGDIIDGLADIGIRLVVKGDELVVNAPREVLTAEMLAKLKASKGPLVRELQRRTGRRGDNWHLDEHGRLTLDTGEVYAPTITGGWILVKHPTKRMREPGTVEVTRWPIGSGITVTELRLIFDNKDRVDVFTQAAGRTITGKDGYGREVTIMKDPAKQ
ncbi:MAG: hypothetical protein FWD61_13135 [Phycisphaerales bacterium]|nr:hypothetical protein [Phycisphaerales bacterium]